MVSGRVRPWWPNPILVGAVAGGIALSWAGEAQAREVFINLSPVTLVDSNGQDPTTDSFTSSGFSAGPVSGFALDEAQRQELLYWLKEAAVPFDLSFTFQRPVGAGYDMAVFGTSADAGARFPDVAGCSTAIGLSDCLDEVAANISFVFYGCLPEADQTDMRRLAFHTLTALGFGWGLESVSVSGEIMGGYSVFGVEFGNSCQSVPSSACAHEQCPSGQQNSTLDLTARLGPRVDDGPPSLAITAPADMAVVDPSFAVDADVTDAFGGLTATLELVEAMQSQEDAEPPYHWDLDNIPPGMWTVRVRAVDADANEVAQEIVVCVGSCDPTDDGSTSDASSTTTSGSSATGDDGSGTSGDDSASDSGTEGGPINPTAPFQPDALGPGGATCNCRSASDAGPAGWGGALALMVAGLRRRRRLTRGG